MEHREQTRALLAKVEEISGFSVNVVADLKLDVRGALQQIEPMISSSCQHCGIMGGTFHTG
jgi:hypothetical protein